jgi:hypothetical protein
MPFNGAGMFVRVRNWVADAAAGVKIRADYHDIEDDGFAAGISQCIARDGQSTVTNNIPMNGKRLVALSDPIDPQDASSKAYADTKLPLTGGTITGNLTVTAGVAAQGYRTRTGLSGALGANWFNFNWTGNLEAWVDNTKLGALATQAYVEQRAQDWAHAIADPKVNRAGDTMTGPLTVNGELVAATNYLRFQSAGGPGYILWNGGGSYTLGGGGTIWHNGNLPNPVTDARLAYIGQTTLTPGQMNEPYAGSVVTGLQAVASGQTTSGCANGAKWRQLQLYNSAAGVWFAIGYVG